VEGWEEKYAEKVVRKDSEFLIGCGTAGEKKKQRERKELEHLKKGNNNESVLKRKGRNH